MYSYNLFCVFSPVGKNNVTFHHPGLLLRKEFKLGNYSKLKDPATDHVLTTKLREETNLAYLSRASKIRAI